MHKDSKRREALIYHAKPKPGKISVVPSKRYASQRDLSLAYSPGVAEPCLEIAKDINNVYKYTSKGNLVAVISNGTAVLGLGDIGPEASKPVMEGKGLLFKIFADIDCFDIEVDCTNVDEFIQTVKNISPTFGGINLEDIKAPESFEIERRLVEELNIPVMHDDQHGTAIISTAAFVNALELTGKKIENLKVVVSGAGSAAVSCINMFCKVGLRPEQVFMFNSKGLITTSNDHLADNLKLYAQPIAPISLGEAMQNADVFLGLSVADIMTAEMLLAMNENPIVFAMANPNPEIDYNLAIKTRKDVIMATGRSDYPNQVNNVLGFPYIFRGALDVRATKINEDMKLAAAHALAELAKLPVPEQVNVAYGETRLSFGKEYIIPKPFDPRLISVVSIAVAKAAIASGVALNPITDWGKYEEELNSKLGGENKLLRLLLNRAKTNPKRIVFTEADQLNVLKVAQICHEDGIAFPILLGNKEIILELKKELDFEDDIQIIDPKNDEFKEWKEEFAQSYWDTHQREGISLLDAQRLMRERNYFAAMMVNKNYADGMVTGYSRSYPSVIRPIMHLIKRSAGVSKISTANLLITNKGPLFLADTAINPNPTASELTEIALLTANTVKTFGIEPIMAMVSYSNFGSAKKETSRKIKEALKMINERQPDLIIDGEIQADFALNNEMLKDKFPFSKLVDRKVNTLIFPNLESANITYKVMKELNECVNVGPIIMGLDMPAHVFQLGSTVEEMVNMVAITVINAQENMKKKK